MEPHEAAPRDSGSAPPEIVLTEATAAISTNRRGRFGYDNWRDNTLFACLGLEEVESARVQNSFV